MSKSVPKDIELHPDAWERFERAADVVAKSPPQHRAKAAPNAKKRRTKRVKKDRAS